MTTLRKRKGKWTVEIRRKSHQNVYGTFFYKSDARSFVYKVESKITQNKYKDISEAATTTFKIALHRYIRKKIGKKTILAPKMHIKLKGGGNTTKKLLKLLNFAITPRTTLVAIYKRNI